MPKRINYTLTTEELLTVEQALKKHPDLRVRERARIIRLLHLGHKHPEVAQLMAISRNQVYWWHQRWREEGLAGLEDRPRSGRPRIGTEALRSQIEALLQTDPTTLGFAFTVWNVPRLLAYLREQYEVQMHENTLRNILEEMDYVYRRPKHDLKSLQDADARAAAEAHLQELKKKRLPGPSNYSLWTKQP